ncbi:hypothetical protein ACOSQ3_006955 [Xanthoceras sorbifolium]
MSRDRRTTRNRKNKLHETAADLAHENRVMEGRNIRINSQGRDLITDIIPKVNDIIGRKTATREEGPMQMINQTLNEEVNSAQVDKETIGQEGFIKSVDIAGDLLNSDASLGPIFHFSSGPKKKQKWKRLARMAQDGINPSSTVGLNAKWLPLAGENSSS